MPCFATLVAAIIRYFNGTIISIFCVPLLPVWPANFTLTLDNIVVALASVKSVITSSSSKADTSL